MKKILLLAATIFCFLNLVNAQPGELDPSFGTNGIVATDLGKSVTSGAPPASQILLQPDGSMYVIQKNQQYLSKRHSNGSIDESFGLNGYSADAGFDINMAAIQLDGKTVVVGSIEQDGNSNFALARFNIDGSLDSSFSGDGKQTTDFGLTKVSDYRSASDDRGYLVAIQKDGKIVVAGLSNQYLALTRYNTNGSLDSTFDGDGLLTSNLDYYYISPYRRTSIAIQSNGKIVVTGFFFIVRFNTDGSLDKTFKEDGIQAFESIDFAAIQSDGKIVVAGSIFDSIGRVTYSALGRFNVDGSLDKSFSGDGKQKTTDFGINSLALQNDGKIVVVGYSFQDTYPRAYFSTLTRYNSDGSLDKSFADGGKQTTGFDFYVVANSVAIQSDGKIVTAGGGGTSSYFALARYNKNGGLDNTFDKDGKLTDGFHAKNTTFNRTAIQKDGKIVAAGKTWNGSNFDFAIARYNIDGSLDNTFSDDGTQTTDFSSGDDYANSVAIQSDGRIVAAGGHALARYNTDGSLDSTFSRVGKQTTDKTIYITSAAIQKDGKIVVAGAASGYSADDYYKYNSEFTIARYDTDGSLDKTFGLDGMQTVLFEEPGYASSVAIQNDGKIVVIGITPNFSSENYINFQFPLVRLNTNGSLDNTFGDNGKTYSNSEGYYGSYQEDISCSVIIQNDGKIVTAGPVYAGSRGTILDRFNTDGSIDSSFDGKSGFYGNDLEFTSIALQSDGKIVMSGADLLRFNTDGSLDRTFNINAKPKVSFQIHDIAIANNKLYAVGGEHYGAVARYLLDGNSNTPPTVSITTPANNATYIAPANIKINVAASDKDGTISKVEFYNGTALLHTETVVPYGFLWRNVPVGNYTITAKATDNSGAVTTSAAVKISVAQNKAPTVNIINPANLKTFTGPANIKLDAAAKDPDGTISKVEFYNGKTLLHTETVIPYGFLWKDVPVGNYSVTAKAYDNFGVATTSAVVTVSVLPNIAPTVSIINPANGEGFTAPADVHLQAAAKDPDGTISKVKFYNGTALLHTETVVPYGFLWREASAGTYTITAVATDDKGLSTTSAPVTVTVTSQGALTVSSRPSSAESKTGVNNAVSINLYPNPANRIVNIHTTGLQQNKSLTISVISASGVAVKTIQSNTSNLQLDVSSLVSGVYTIKIMNGSKILYKQFVKL